MLIILLGLGFLQLLSSCNGCDLPWEKGYNDHCYFFSHYSTNFHSAMRMCKILGGMLVEVDDEQEFSDLAGMAHRKKFPNFFIGVTDLHTEGNWMKATTYDFQLYQNWAPGEPNNDGGQHCVQVYTGQGMKWDDVWCNAERHFVCEKIDIFN